MQWFVTLPLELVAATIIIGYWDKHQHVSPGVWVIICWVVIAVINIFGVRGYGDFEVFGSVLKILCVPPSCLRSLQRVQFNPLSSNVTLGLRGKRMAPD